MQHANDCDQLHMSPEHRRNANCNHPDAFDWPLRGLQVHSLRSGQTIEMLVCGPTEDDRSRKAISVQAAPVIVMAHLFALYAVGLGKMMSLKVSVDTASDGHFVRCMQHN